MSDCSFPSFFSSPVHCSFESVARGLKNGLTPDISLDDIEEMLPGLATRLSLTVESFFEELDLDEAAEILGEKVGQATQKFGWKTFTKGAPLLLTGIALTSGVPLCIKFLYDVAVYNLSKPALATRYQRTTILNTALSVPKTLFHKVFPKKEEPRSEPIFNKEITRQINNIAQSLQNTRKNKGVFQNILFHGPGGTGKTMIAEKLAKESGMDFVMMSGGDLAQYIKRGEHVTMLNHLMLSVQVGWKPTVLFIDELESLARARGKTVRSELLELQNAFLSHTGTPNKQLILIGATNLLGEIDEAVLTRFDRKIFIGPPAQAEREKIIRQYAEQLFTEAEVENFFSEKQIYYIAKKAAGFTGRALFKMMNEIHNIKVGTEKNQLTKEIRDETVQDFVNQESLVRKLTHQTDPNRSLFSFLRPWFLFGY